MGLFSKLFKEPEVDLEKSEANRQKMQGFVQPRGGEWG